METVWRWLRDKSLLLYGGVMAAVFLFAENRLFPAGAWGWLVVAGMCLTAGIASNIMQLRYRRTAFQRDPPPDGGVWCPRTPRQVLALADEKLTGLEQERRIAPLVGTWVFVEGRVTDVNANAYFDGDEEVSITIRLPTWGLPGLSLLGSGSVFASFSKGKYGHLEALQKGDRIGFVGKLDKVIPTVAVCLEECELKVTNHSGDDDA